MSKHLQTEIEKLKRKIIHLGTVVEDSVRKAVLSVNESNGELAKQIIDEDINIDHEEVEIEEECLKILALHQPVAIDLRFIIAVLKINDNLERIGDLAVNIAERAVFLARSREVTCTFDFSDMANKVQAMLKQSLDALVNMDSDLAQVVCAADDEIDAANRQMYVQVQDAIRKGPEHLEALVHLLSTSRHLERIADMATNIAEDVIYMVKGEIIRHQTEDC